MTEWKRMFLDFKFLGVWIFSLFAFCLLFVYTYQVDKVPEIAKQYESIIKDFSSKTSEVTLQELEYTKEEYSNWLGIYNMYTRYEDKKEIKNSLLYDFYLQKAPDQLMAWENGDFYFSTDKVNALQYKLIAIEEIIEQIKYQQEYPQYIKNIQSNADNMSQSQIFNSSPFSRRNIQKTSNDYQDLNDVKLQLMPEKSVTAFFSFPYTDFFLLLWQAVFCLKLVDEQKKGLYEIIYSSVNGRSRLSFQRMEILLVFSFFSTISTYTVLFITSINCLGSTGSLSRMVQCNSLFQYFPLPISMRVFIVYLIMAKTLVLFLISCILWLVYKLSNGLKISLVVFSGFLIVEGLCYYWIPDQNVFSIIKYINIFSYIRTFSTLCIYKNINIFNFPISLQILLFTFLLIIVVIFCLLIFFCSAVSKPVSIVKQRLTGIQQVIPNWYKGEGQKILIGQKGVIVLLTFIIECVWLVDVLPLPYNADRDIQEYYWTQVNEMELKDANTWLEEKFDTLKIQIDLSSSDRLQTPDVELEQRTLEQQISALSTVQNEVKRLSYLDSQGYDVDILNLKPYEALLYNDSNYTRYLSIIVQILSLVLLLSGLFAYENENQMQIILKCTYRGRSALWIRKMAWSLGLIILVWAISNGSELLKIILVYGQFEELSIDIQTIPQYNDFSIQISIIFYMVIMYVMRLVGLFVAGFGIIFVSSFCQKTSISLVLNCIFWLFPIGLEMFTNIGMEILHLFSLSCFFIPLTFDGLIIVLITWCVVGFIAIIGSWIKWNIL